MAAVSKIESRGVGDILDSTNYRFEIGQIPGGINDRNMSIQCTQAVYPGVQNETFAVVFPGGHELTFKGRKVFPKTLQISYAEAVSMNITKNFGNWFEFLSGTESGLSQGYKAAYSIDGAKLTIFDLVGNTPDVITFYGLQPTDRPDVNLDSSGSGAWLVSVSMAYDFYYSTLYGPSSGVSFGLVGGGPGNF